MNCIFIIIKDNSNLRELIKDNELYLEYTTQYPKVLKELMGRNKEKIVKEKNGKLTIEIQTYSSYFKLFLKSLKKQYKIKYIVYLTNKEKIYYKKKFLKINKEKHLKKINKIKKFKSIIQQFVDDPDFEKCKYCKRIEENIYCCDRCNESYCENCKNNDKFYCLECN